jgi:hypothetical protein
VKIARGSSPKPTVPTEHVVELLLAAVETIVGGPLIRATLE